ncbi:MAG: DMT family transporter [Flavobacteriaceae bacterium]|nr:DMT family transporter [Flavobacteriaceae bacterium]
MPNAKLSTHIHLHFLVFIAGFTAIIGELISIDSFSLVWYRMMIALGLMYAYAKFKNRSFRISFYQLRMFAFAGVVIALHWITFFEAIKQSNVSVTLAMFSTGAFFAALLEAAIYKRKPVAYELWLGIVVVFGLLLILKTEVHQYKGMILGVLSAFLAALFSVLNGKLVKGNSATVISVYEFASGILFISLYVQFFGVGFGNSFFEISQSDWWFLMLLGSVCTTYPFIAAIDVMRKLSAYTVVLSYNLEPVYGILLALVFFPKTENMPWTFYLGTAVILVVVLLNALWKDKKLE